MLENRTIPISKSPANEVLLKKICVITLGCPKNISDSEILLNQFKLNNFEIVPVPQKADVVLINTCGFIQDSKMESLETIFEMIDLKKKGIIKKVYVLGCLYERYKNELRDEIKEVDNYFGMKDTSGIIKKIGGKFFPNNLYQHNLITPPHYAYLKISDGCDHSCSFCAIPKIKGKYQSKEKDYIVTEAKDLLRNGVKELILIAQDTTYYGKDIYGKRQIVELLKKLLKTEKIDWLRLLYTYPTNFPLEILDIVLDNLNFCKYIDMPIQHISDRVLKSMRRGINKQNLLKLIEIIKSKIPEIALRTSIIVGYPEERKSDFKELLKFVEETEFDRLGVFIYSKEDNTPAYKLKDRVPMAEKLERKELIMETQRKISRINNKRMLNTVIKVLVDSEDRNNFYGRTEYDAPEIDNMVILSKSNFNKNKLKIIGNFLICRVSGYSDYDLYAIPV